MTIEGYARYAVYWAPEAGSDLARFGAAWLGWDAEAGETRAHPAVAGLPASAAELTETPRRYGFHATVKPPFVPAPGASGAQILAALRDLAARTAPFAAPPLTLVDRHGFLSLRFSAPSPDMTALAAAAVEALDPFRAPPTEADLAKRRGKGLPPEAEANLTRWGYPWVMGLFDFHLTLSNALDAPTLAALAAAMEAPTAPFRAGPLPVRELCLFGDPGAGPQGGGRFRLLARAPLGG